MQVVLRSLDKQAIAFEAMMYRVGEGGARRAFARALTHEGKKGHTAVVRSLAKQTSIKVGDIRRAVRFHSASPQTLRTVNRATGSAIPLRYFGARQFKYGVRARVWGRNQRYPGAFIVASLGGTVFKNTGGWNARQKRFNQIDKMFGPSIPKEMLTPTVVAAFNQHAETVTARAHHELNRTLRV